MPSAHRLLLTAIADMSRPLAVSAGVLAAAGICFGSRVRLFRRMPLSAGLTLRGPYANTKCGPF